MVAAQQLGSVLKDGHCDFVCLETCPDTDRIHRYRMRDRMDGRLDYLLYVSAVQRGCNKFCRIYHTGIYFWDTSMHGVPMLIDPFLCHNSGMLVMTGCSQVLAQMEAVCLL
jgi:hypothetical protein